MDSLKRKTIAEAERIRREGLVYMRVRWFVLLIVAAMAVVSGGITHSWAASKMLQPAWWATASIWFGLGSGLLAMVGRSRDIRNAGRMADEILRQISEYSGDAAKETFPFSPTMLGKLLSFLVPRRVREECFEPFFEDLKADCLENLARTGSRGVKRWIEFCFYFRLCITVVQSLVCYLGELLSKLAPLIRAVFFKGGS